MPARRSSATPTSSSRRSRPSFLPGEGRACRPSPVRPAGLAGPGQIPVWRAAAAWAERAHAPLLLATGATVGAATRAEIGSLHPRDVLAVGVARRVLTSQLRGIRVVTRPAALPVTSALPAAGHVVVLVHRRNDAAAAAAAVTTAEVAGAQVITVHSAAEINAVSNWLAHGRFKIVLGVSASRSRGG